MDRGNHYEAAFEAYLRDRRLGYVAVDESRRSSLDDEPVKSIDFIVYGHGGARLLVDIKGRKFPGGKAGRPRYTWQNWVVPRGRRGARTLGGQLWQRVPRRAGVRVLHPAGSRTAAAARRTCGSGRADGI